jgi:subtilisin family serine protease/PKD repeat protein
MFQLMFFQVRKYYLSLSLVLLTVAGFAQQLLSHDALNSRNTPPYAPHTIIIKLSPDTGARFRSGTDKLSQLRQEKGVVQIERALYPRRPASSSQLARRSAIVDIEHIYKVRVQEGVDLPAMIGRFSRMDGVIYAEPYYLLKPLGSANASYEPNDPEAASSSGEQSYLSSINAYQAWALEKGDSSITIGVLDTGIEFGHQDLSDNLRQNEYDPINGIDDDGDGYVDNFTGWDFADDDNDPTADQSGHGTNVTGVSSATANNGVGMAGIGFVSTYVPLKVFRSTDGSFNQGYEAIAYAADMGYQVLNLSWGGANAYSRFGQDMINYAVLEKDVVVVAAAGNSGQQEDFYPASFENVLSVAQSDDNGNRVGATTSSYFVDLMAPGQRIFTTTENDTYQLASGSSLATPLVAGTAALMRARFPDMSAQQIAEKLRLSAQDVYDQSANSGYEETLGNGFLDMARSLNEQSTPAIRMTDFEYKNHVGAYAFYGDTLNITASFTNFLTPATGGSVTLSTPSEYVSMLDSVFTIGNLDSLATAENTNQPFRLRLSEATPPLEQLYFRLAYQADGYTDYQYFFIVTSPDYTDIDNGTFQLPLGSQAQIGMGSTRDGLIFRGDTLAHHLGFMLATGEDSVSSNMINDFSQQTYDSDFLALKNIRQGRSNGADRLLTSAFNDSDADNPLSLKVEQQWLSDTSGAEQELLISEYRLVNRGSDSLFSLYPAIFADWDIRNARENRAGWDAAHHLAYVYDDSLYCGLALLGQSMAAYYAIDKQDLNGNTADLQQMFSDSLRYAWISSDTPKNEAGMSGAGNDVAHLLGMKIDTLAPNQDTRMALAWVFATDLARLQAQVALAQDQYDAHRQNPRISFTVFTCTDSTATIRPPEGGIHRFYRDPLGNHLLAEDTAYATGALAGDTSLYLATLNDGYETPLEAVAIRILEPQASFQVQQVQQGSFFNDTLFLNTTEPVTLAFEDQSTNATGWQWDFGNGFQDTRQNPSTFYENEGTYTVRLRVRSAAGCVSETSRTLTVIRRAEKPVITDSWICPNEPESLRASNTDQIKVYSDAALSQLLFSGQSFTSAPLTSDTIFYVVNAASAYESVAEQVEVKIIQPEVDIHYELDTTGSSKFTLSMWALPVDVNDSPSGYQWYVDDQLVGNGDTILYDYSWQHALGQDFEIQLTFNRSEGDVTCQQAVVQLIQLEQSPDPTLDNLQVCRGESVSLRPNNGQLFYFYTDADLAEPVYTGTSYTVAEVQGQMTFYITNIDSLLESEATEVQVVLNRFADFSLSEDTLFLQEGQEVTFEAFTLTDDTGEVSWQWDLGDGQLMNREAQVTQTYDSVGEYRIRLVAQTRDGCSNTVAKTLVVKNITSVEQELENESLLLYPNPSSGIFTLANERWSYQKIMLQLYDAQGKALRGKQLQYDILPVQIDLHALARQQLPDGVYTLWLQVADKQFLRRLMLSSDR